MDRTRYRVLGRGEKRNTIFMTKQNVLLKVWDCEGEPEELQTAIVLNASVKKVEDIQI